MNDLSIDVIVQGRRFSDATAGLEFAARQLQGDWEAPARRLSMDLKMFLDKVALTMAQRHSGGWPSGTTGKTLSRRTGQLAQSIAQSVRVSGATLATVKGEIGGNWKARIHERGATIRPKSAKFIAVPLPPALTKNGLPIARGPRFWRNTFVAESRKGNLIVFQKRAAKIVPLYVLKPQVRLPPRLGLRAEVQRTLPYFLEKSLDAIVRDALKPVGGRQ